MEPDYWESAKKHLSRADPVLKKLIKAYPNMAISSRGDEFQTLARAIVGQQISTKAAASIWNRFEACSGAVTPGQVATLEPESMRACGLSNAKVRYIHDLAQHFASGSIRPKRWPKMDDEAIIEDLVRVKGVGMRPDLLPVDDLGLRRAMERQFNRGRALTKDKMRRIASRWAPYRSVATWYLWRSLEPPPEAP